MHNSRRKYLLEFQRRLKDEKIDLAVIYDPDTLYYLCGFWGYLGMEFGRPTLLVVPAAGAPTLITPGLESEMAAAMTGIDDIRQWTDGVGAEWRQPLDDLLTGRLRPTVGIEFFKTHPMICQYVKERLGKNRPTDITRILSELRMVKSAEDIEALRCAGKVAVAMCAAAVDVIGAGVPEHEICLAAMAAGTRKAAELLDREKASELYSPVIHNLQVLQSGPDLSMVHRRPTRRRMQNGDPVYLCFCPFTLFKQIKLGFDRQYFVGQVSDRHAAIYTTALEAQAAALETIRPGIPAEEVHRAALEVYQNAGFGICYRTGRAVGYSFLEHPEFKQGDKTLLQAGMTFAVDGGITIAGQFGARVGDSIVVTENGFEYLTPFPKDLKIL
jgi:Xaa-Pro aminopeptidase